MNNFVILPIVLSTFLNNGGLHLIECSIELIVSGENSIVTDPGPPHPATVLSNTWIPTSNAKWIWHNQNTIENCYRYLSVEHTFTIRCLNLPLTLYIQADDTYSFAINGFSGSSSDYTKVSIYTTETQEILCGNTFFIQDNILHSLSMLQINNAIIMQD